MTPESREIIWTPERLETLKKLREAGETYASIAATLGCSKNAVVSAWHRKWNMHVTWSRLNKADKEARLAEINALIVEEKLRQIPTLSWVPGLRDNQKYRMVRVNDVGQSNA